MVKKIEIKMNEIYVYQIDPNYLNDNLSEMQDKISELEDSLVKTTRK